MASPERMRMSMSPEKKQRNTMASPDKMMRASLNSQATLRSSAGKNIFRQNSEGKATVITDKVTQAIVRRVERVKGEKIVTADRVGSESVVGKGITTLRGLGGIDEEETEQVGDVLTKLEAEADEQEQFLHLERYEPRPSTMTTYT